MAHEYYCAKCDDTFLWNRVAAGPRAGDAAPDGESLLPEAEIVFRVAAETHPGGAHAAIVAELDRLRSEVAALERQRDHLQGQLDIIHDAEYSRNDALRRENTRLRAELDAILDEDEDTPSAALADADRVCRLLAAGNALAAVAADLLDGISPQSWSVQREDLRLRSAAWRSAAGTPTTDGGEHQ